MENYKQIYAPELIMYTRHYSSNGFNESTALTEESQRLYNLILQEVQKIKPTVKDRTIWELWFCAPKGSLEDFGDYEELHEEGVYDTYEEFENEWKEFDKEEYWFRLSIVIEDNFSSLWLDNASIITIIEDDKNKHWSVDYDELLCFLLYELRKIVEMVIDGTYNDYLNEKLPYEYREGVIQRSKLIQYAPKFREVYLEDLSDDEINAFINYLDGECDSDAPSERITEMTAGKYYDICSYCYCAAKYKDLEGKMPKQMFMRYGDNRDGGLSTLDENSVEAFDNWYQLSTMEKWEINNSSHMWEISQGSTHTRLHLSLMKDSSGYYFVLSGGSHYATEVVVRMFTELKKRGVPIVLRNAEIIKNKVLGLDEVGVIIEFEDSHSYAYGGFSDKKIINFIHLEDIAKENRQDFIKAVNWFSLVKVEGNKE